MRRRSARPLKLPPAPLAAHTLARYGAGGSARKLHAAAWERWREIQQTLNDAYDEFFGRWPLEGG